MLASLYSDVMPTPAELAAGLTTIRFVAAFSLTDGIKLIVDHDLQARAVEAGIFNTEFYPQRSDGTHVTWDPAQLGLQTTIHPSVSALMNSWQATMMIAIYDALRQTASFPHAEVTEFARHLRNAAAHDMTLNITRHAKDAAFAGITIAPTDHGKPVYSVVQIGDVAALLDFVIDELSKLP